MNKNKNKIKYIVDIIIKKFNIKTIKCNDLIFKINTKNNIEKFIKKYINNNLYKYKNYQKNIWNSALKYKKKIIINNKEYIFDLYKFKKNTIFYHTHYEKNKLDTFENYIWTTSHQMIYNICINLKKTIKSKLKLKIDIDLIHFNLNNMKNIYNIIKDKKIKKIIKYIYFYKNFNDFCNFIKNKYKNYKGYSNNKLKRWNISLYSYEFSIYICKLLYDIDIDITNEIFIKILNSDYDILKEIKKLFPIIGCKGYFHKYSYDPFVVFNMEEYVFNTKNINDIFDITHISTI